MQITTKLQKYYGAATVRLAKGSEIYTHLDVGQLAMQASEGKSKEIS